MGLGHLKVELDELAGELDEACQVPDAVQQPEVARARALVEEARAALSSAFLSRRALVMARDAIGRAQGAVEAALEVSRVLHGRSAALRAQGADVRAMASEARPEAARLRDWADRTVDLGPAPPGEVAIESDLPADLPEKAAIEAAMSRTLAGVEGQWRVAITMPSSGGWWGLRVSGPSVEWVGTLLEPGEKTPAAIASRLEPLVQMARAEALYRRTLRAARRRKDRETD
jgi:hypothetical protein